MDKSTTGSLDKLVELFATHPGGGERFEEIVKDNTELAANALVESIENRHQYSFSFCKRTISELDSQVRYLVDYMDERGLLDEEYFTFPHGITVWVTGKEPTD